MQADRENEEIGQNYLYDMLFWREALELSRLEDWYSRHPHNAQSLLICMVLQRRQYMLVILN